MPRNPRPIAPALTSRVSGIQQYVKLENRLVLLAWLNSLLGYGSNRELLEDTQTVAEGFGADGRSFLYHHLIARGSQVKIPADYLACYDENIHRHLEKINRGRAEPPCATFSTWRPFTLKSSSTGYSTTKRNCWPT